MKHSSPKGVGPNPSVHSLLDTLFWAVATVTTVGESGVSPVTFNEKIVAMLMMILGSLFLWSYTALFVTAPVCPELRVVEDEVRNLEAEFTTLETKGWDRCRLESLFKKMEAHLLEKESG